MSEVTCYVAEFAYDATEADELTLEPGEIILDAKPAPDDGWMTGLKESTGKSGLFPDNFVKECQKATMRQSHQRLSAGTSVFVVKRGDQQTTIYTGRQFGGKLSVPTMCLDFDSRGGNAVVGTTGGSLGGGEKQPRSSRLVGGVGLGDIFSGKQITLKRTDDPQLPQAQAPAQKPKPPGAAAKPVGGKPLPTTQPQPVSKPAAPASEDLVIVQYRYEATNADELGLEPGQIVHVLDRNLEDEGWWRGELNGKTGVFPDNFVAPYQPQSQGAAARGSSGGGTSEKPLSQTPPQPQQHQPPPPVVKAPVQTQPPPPPPKPKESASVENLTSLGSLNSTAQLEQELRQEIKLLRSQEEEQQREVQELKKFKRATQQELLELKEELDAMTKKYHNVMVDVERLKREFQALLLNK